MDNIFKSSASTTTIVSSSNTLAMKQIVTNDNSSVAQFEGQSGPKTLRSIVPFTVSFNNLKYEIIDKKNNNASKMLLNGVSGCIQPGESLAIMGPSGAGKSTLLEVLGNRLSSGKISGSLRYNGIRLQGMNKRQVKFVQQQDSLNGVLSVNETLWYASHLTQDITTTEEERKEIINDIIQILGLQSCKDTKVGNMFIKGLSGGQLRRLSIAVELIANPSVLFLDEPTSGLDSRSAFSVIEYIIKLAGVGKTIILTIHQPSTEILCKFSKLLLLSAGKTIYLGPTSIATEYFTTVLNSPCPPFTNPSEHYIKCINVDFDDHIDITWAETQFNSSALGIEEKALVREWIHDSISINDIDDFKDREKRYYLWGAYKKFAVPRYYQTFILLKRQLLCNLRDPGIYWVRSVLYAGLGLALSSIFYSLGTSQSSVPDRISMLFFINAFMVFMSLSALPFFMEERHVFLRERGNKMYSVDSYTIAICLAAIPGV